jgi:glycosyltransferase involved in cell wall biosynthesis
VRIAQVAPLYESVPPKRYGGTERVVSELTEELVRQGHEVTLFASGDSMTSARLIPCCSEALRLNAVCIDQLAHHVVMIEQVMSQKDEFDIIHFHVDYLHFPFSRREQVANVSTLHGRLDLPDLVPIYQTFRDMPVISISNAQRKPLPWLNWQDTVYHGMSADRYRLYPQGGDYLAFLGRTSPEKGLDRAIEIAKRTGMPLKIAAKIDKADADYFEAVIKPLLNTSLIEFIGEIGYPEKNEFLGNAAGLLFPIDWPEPFGLVMIEAMACGTPIIAFNNGSVPEIMRHRVTGFVVSSIDNAVRGVHNLASIDRRAVRGYFEECFTVERMARDYLQIYKRLAHGDEQPSALRDGVLSWMKLESPSSTT